MSPVRTVFQSDGAPPHLTFLDKKFPDPWLGISGLGVDVCRAINVAHTKMYPKVSELASWNERCKWYSSLPLGAVVSLFCESV